MSEIQSIHYNIYEPAEAEMERRADEAGRRRAAVPHAPLPLAIEEGAYIVDANGNDVADCNAANVTATDENNAAFIVRACNAHDDLLAALPVVTQLFEDCIEGGAGELEGDREAIAAARAAIAKARGEAE